MNDCDLHSGTRNKHILAGGTQSEGGQNHSLEQPSRLIKKRNTVNNKYDVMHVLIES